MKADIVVIGAGTTGLKTAMIAASNGKKTVLIGDRPLGGTCLNNGCIPTKAMLHAADVFRTASRGEEVGIKAEPQVDFSKVMKRVRSIVKEGRSHIGPAIEKTANLTYIEGRAKFIGKRGVQVGRQKIMADKILVATGASAFIPPVPGLEGVPYLTNVEVVDLKKQPEHLLIIGGGFIACEYATFFATLGTKVTILERGPVILSHLDEGIRQVVHDSLEEMGVRLMLGVVTTKVSHKKGRFTCLLSGAEQQSVSSDALLVAAGRKPNTGDLGLDEAGIKLTDRGFIKVNSALRTSNRHVYAIGDVNGEALFAHAAKREGWLALERILLGKRIRYDPDTVPWAVFTHPPVAGVGLCEHVLEERNEPFSVLEAPFSKCGKARIIREQEGFVKVLHHEGHVLGAQIVGPDADNLIHEFVALLHAGAQGMRLLRKTVHVHPTLAEVFEALKPRH